MHRTHGMRFSNSISDDHCIVCLTHKAHFVLVLSTHAAMPSLIPLDNLLGAAFVGVIISTAQVVHHIHLFTSIWRGYPFSAEYMAWHAYSCTCTTQSIASMMVASWNSSSVSSLYPYVPYPVLSLNYTLRSLCWCECAFKITRVSWHASVRVLDTLNLIFLAHVMYHYMVTNFGDYQALVPNVW